MSIEKVIVNDEEMEVEVKPITLICHRGDMDIKIPHRVEISAPRTIEIANTINARNLAFVRKYGGHLFDMVFASTGVTMPETLDELTTASTGVKHIIGMLTMIFDATLKGQQIFLRQPEAFLHPAQQVGLADVLITLTKGGTTNESK